MAAAVVSVSPSPVLLLLLLFALLLLLLRPSLGKGGGWRVSPTAEKAVTGSGPWAVRAAAGNKPCCLFRRNEFCQWGSGERAGWSKAIGCMPSRPEEIARAGLLTGRAASIVIVAHSVRGAAPTPNNSTHT